MTIFRVFAAAAVLCVVAASVDAAQGASGGRGATRTPRPAPTGAQGPRAERPNPPNADRGAREAKPTPRAGAQGQQGKAIADNIAKNPQLEARLTAMLPSGMTLDRAADGFRNQGQFIAALEASRNQSIPFTDLKREMTGDSALSLGQAVQKLRPAERAEGR